MKTHISKLDFCTMLYKGSDYNLCLLASSDSGFAPFSSPTYIFPKKKAVKYLSIINAATARRKKNAKSAYASKHNARHRQLAHMMTDVAARSAACSKAAGM